ncbi:MAG: DASS family sodium-coupled anion symporter [Paludibacter sp.]|nr:DASS family sodium-coupled anion symporter [Paludibacter sp.]
MLSTKLIGLLSGIIFFVLILLLPTPNSMSIEAKSVAAVVVLMSIWWLTAAIPIYATAFLPLVLFPLLKILPAQDTAANYAHNFVFMMLGGFILAKAIETQNLHKRIALVLMNIFGTGRKRIILSIMLATAFLSMWISNITTALLMLPIALAIVVKEETGTNGATTFSKALILGVAYSATIGGLGTLIGSPTNLILVGVMEKIFPQAPPITFFQWLKIGLPILIILLPIIWFYLIKYFKVTGFLSDSHEVIKQDLNNLGKMSVGEKGVMYVFLIAVFGWVFRDGFEFGNFMIKGWGELTGLQGYVHDSTVALLAVLLLFILPAGNNKKLMEWKDASQIPWGVLVIVGGGYALAESFKVTGLADWLGQLLLFVNNFSPLVVLIIVVVFISFFTELNPNTATVNIFLPVLASLAIVSNTNPLLLMIPATVASSFAFMMPAGTGPNTIAFASERLTISEMAKSGLGIKFISLVILILLLYFIIMPSLNLQTTLPDWAK